MFDLNGVDLNCFTKILLWNFSEMIAVAVICANRKYFPNHH